MIKTKGYSLWLMPEGEIYKKLAGIISDLSKRYKTPKFEPHVTLLGEVEKYKKQRMISWTSSLSRLIKPFEIKLDGVDYRGETFKSLFIKVEESRDIMHANFTAKKVFGLEFDYKPHLSLLYGDIDQRIKKAIITELGDFDLSFAADKIHLYSTRGEPKKWHKIDEFKLEK